MATCHLLLLLLLHLLLLNLTSALNGLELNPLSQFNPAGLMEVAPLWRSENLMDLSSSSSSSSSSFSSSSSSSVSLSRKKRYLALPVGSNIEIKWSMNFPFNTFTLYEAATTLAIPIKIPIPDSLVLDEERVKRSLSQYQGSQRVILDAIRGKEDRREKAYLYNYFESAFGKAGMSGRGCVLRAICEVAEAPFDQGLFGELVNAMLTPSLAGKPTKEEAWLQYTDYLEAEVHGEVVGSCEEKYLNCTVSPFDVLHEAVYRIAN
ncbi:uncharacterized protein LOC123503602 [Portunus trituberculatus]|uniref:uncharacterized protein LOC123503602 n=1 Tax=Portunus trituberculatus TaxID=210409 RepID=UPI001E1CD48C|nr:uncharacterized protein LOC123503602 [Portunus trituberculatus]